MQKNLRLLPLAFSLVFFAFWACRAHPWPRGAPVTFESWKIHQEKKLAKTGNWPRITQTFCYRPKSMRQDRPLILGS